MTKEEAINYLISSGFSEEQVSEVVRALTYEPTTKNDLGVDCISRKSVITIIQNHWWNCRDIDKLVNDLPSVTPQEPILDKIRAEIMKLDDINPDYPMDRTIHISRNEVLQIIDKYMVESEDT